MKTSRRNLILDWNETLKCIRAQDILYDASNSIKDKIDAFSAGVDISGTPVANDIARFTDADTIEGRSYNEFKSDISLNNVNNTSDANKPVSSAQQTALNAKQNTLTFGIANNNAVDIDDADAAENDYCKLTTAGIVGRSYSEVRSDIGVIEVMQSNITVNFTTSDSQGVITGLIAAIPKNQNGQTLTFVWADGNYDNKIFDIGGFYSGQMLLYGNPSERASYATSKSVKIRTDVGGFTGLYLHNCNSQVSIKGIEFATTYTGSANTNAYPLFVAYIPNPVNFQGDVFTGSPRAPGVTLDSVPMAYCTQSCFNDVDTSGTPSRDALILTDITSQFTLANANVMTNTYVTYDALIQNGSRFINGQNLAGLNVSKVKGGQFINADGTLG